MKPDPFPRLLDQLVEVLRQGIQTGRWKGSLPGRDRLAKDLGVSHVTMEKAMRRLAKDGLLVSDGVGKRRRIVLPESEIMPKHYRIRILLYESADRKSTYINDLLDSLKMAGISADLANKTLQDLGMNPKRIARFVEQNQVDAWIVQAGSREVLEWFSDQPMPAYALFGVRSAVPLASCGVRHDIQPIIRHLSELGHRRIVLLLREEHLVPQPSLFPRNFMKALESEGITPSSYHLPVWGYRPEGLHRCLESLFKISPPTALIAAEAPILFATRDHLARRGIIAPRDVSMICLDYDSSFDWFDPLISHFTWDHVPIVRRVVRWAKNVARGKEDRRQTVTMARFVEGGTIGPVPDERAKS